MVRSSYFYLSPCFPPLLHINLSQLPPPNQERRSMRAHLSSVLSSPIPTNPYYSPPPSFNLHPKPFSSKSRKPSFSKLITSKNTQGINVDIIDRKIGNTEPPWFVPAPPYNPSHGNEGLMFDHHHDAYFSAVPISLRLLQMRKKNEKLAMSDAPAVELGSVGRAVWSLNCLIEEMQLPALPAQHRVRVLRDGRASMVWLFQKVFSVSPNLAVGFLDLTANFMVCSMEGMMRKIGVDFLEPDYGCWSDIGILDESEKKKISGDNYMSKKMAYEEMIIREKHNSMIYSNYAQLLYQYEKDYDRAKHYFELSVTVEPVDAEAMSRYGHFLWQEIGEMQTAEQMFLEAIAADPENNYHRSNYALFLWKTGGTDTCYPLNEPNISKKGDEDEETEVYDKEVQAESWSDIGILKDSEKPADSHYIRKKMVNYERMIINGKTNSLILSNYAQLLYQYEHDLDRANHYFDLSVTAEPLDAEAMSRYAVFLWEERGDVEMAEEMFLKATSADPENKYHQRNYARFSLRNKGATDTCYPPDDCSTPDEDEGEGIIYETNI